MSDTKELTDLDEATYGNQAAEFELHTMRLQIAGLKASLAEQRGAHERAAHVARDLQAENERLKKSIGASRQTLENQMDLTRELQTKYNAIQSCEAEATHVK